MSGKDAEVGPSRRRPSVDDLRIALLEIAVLIVCTVLGLWWFSRTSRWSHMKRGRERGQGDLGREQHHLDSTQRELSRKHFRDDEAGAQYGGGGA